MSKDIFHVPDDSAIAWSQNLLEQFKTDVQIGLSKSNKQIPPKYFYNDRGSELFNQITRHPDYYLTRCELEILNTHKKEFANFFDSKTINLIELGSGEGVKSKLLLEEFLSSGLDVTYIPIDISSESLKKSLPELTEALPKLNIKAINSDYFKGLEWLNLTSKQQNFVLFLGSSIGNFDRQATIEFLKNLWQVLHDGDLVLLGFDLLKDINTLIRAYNDRDGITREFNLNLLQRINRELNADFNIDKFSHYNTFNVYNSAMESYLVSLEKQIITVGALNQTFDFNPFEAIHVEYSHKYHLTQIEHFANTAGFKIVKNYIDSKEFFVDSLWQVHKSTTTFARPEI